MPVQQFIILDGARVTSSRAMNDRQARIEPRLVDTASPGTVVDQDSNVVDLIGKALAPRRIVLDPLYPPVMKVFLANLPFALVNSDTVFLPVSAV